MALFRRRPPKYNAASKIRLTPELCSGPWHGIDNLLSAMTYWSELQTALMRDDALRGTPHQTGIPYFDGDDLHLPDRFDANTAELYTNHLIRRHETMFSLRKSGRGDRGTTFDDAVDGWFGTFEDAAKYFVATKLGSSTQMALRSKPDPVWWRWLDIGLPGEWDVQPEQEPGPNGFPRSARFFRVDDPARFYFTSVHSADTATAWVLDLTWDEIITAFTADMPTAARVSRPVFG